MLQNGQIPDVMTKNNGNHNGLEAEEDEEMETWILFVLMVKNLCNFFLFACQFFTQ